MNRRALIIGALAAAMASATPSSSRAKAVAFIAIWEELPTAFKREFLALSRDWERTEPAAKPVNDALERWVDKWG